MSDDMTDKFRIFRRASGVWYIEDRESREQESLRTRDPVEAKRLLNAKNEAHRQPAINIQIARAYLSASDPQLVTRTWNDVMEVLVKQKHGSNLDRWVNAINDKRFESIRDLPLIETRSDHFLKLLEGCKVSSNVFLRRIHNFALAMDWLLKPVIPKASWPKVHFKSKRAIKLEEHQRILTAEINPERKLLYQLCWHLGASQGDVASLRGENVDWENKVISFRRRKTSAPVLVHVCPEVLNLFKDLPSEGILFPYLSKMRASDRATEFKSRCRQLGVEGVTLHSYRYAWAERARKAGYPQRYAQEALGHNSKAVHQAYAKKAEVEVPSLDEWENEMKKKVNGIRTN